MRPVSKKEFYKKIKDLNVQLHSYFTAHYDRNYLDQRPSEAKIQNCDFSLKNGQLIGRSSINYSLSYNKQKTIYFLNQ